MERNLIVDVGMHKCEDTDFYLKRGFRVVAIDADPRLIDQAREQHPEEVLNEKLKLINCAVGPQGEEIEFHLSEKSVWNSVNKNISNRDSMYRTSIRVPVRRLGDVFREYGTPLYCKIDIEGFDAACLQTIERESELPRFLSVESECLADGEKISDEKALETLDRLFDLGYRRFKLVDQRSLAVLAPYQKVFRNRPTLFERILKRAGIRDYGHWEYSQLKARNRERLIKYHAYNFPSGSSGPFGDDLDGSWLDYSAAKKMLLRHRREYFSLPNTRDFDFWCDWHATM